MAPDLGGSGYILVRKIPTKCLSELFREQTTIIEGNSQGWHDIQDKFPF
jgi:hypothetical protein